MPSVDATADTSAPPTPTPIAITLTEPAANLVAAYRDGDSAWTPAPAPINETYTFIVRSRTWSFAWACAATLSNGERRAYAYTLSFTVAERTKFAAPASCPRGATGVTIDGTITNAPVGSYLPYFGALGGSIVGGGTNNTYTFSVLRKPGTHDLYIALREPVGGRDDTIKIAVKRGVAAVTNINNLIVDFATAVATTPPLPVTVTTGDPNVDTAARTIFYDGSGTLVDLDYSWVGPPHTTRGIAASQLGTGYVYEQAIRARRCSTDYCDFVDVEHWSQTIAAQAVTVPPFLGSVTTTPSPTSLTLTWPAYASAIGYTFFVQQGGALIWQGTLGGAYAATSPEFVIPDMSGLAGWSEYILRSTYQSSGFVQAVTSTAGATDFPPAYPAPAGTDRVFARGHVLAPPQ